MPINRYNIQGGISTDDGLYTVHQIIQIATKLRTYKTIPGDSATQTEL